MFWTLRNMLMSFCLLPTKNSRGVFSIRKKDTSSRHLPSWSNLLPSTNCAISKLRNDARQRGQKRKVRWVRIVVFASEYVIASSAPRSRPLRSALPKGRREKQGLARNAHVTRSTLLNYRFAPPSVRLSVPDDSRIRNGSLIYPIDLRHGATPRSLCLDWSRLTRPFFFLFLFLFRSPRSILAREKRERVSHGGRDMVPMWLACPWHMELALHACQRGALRLETRCIF